MTVGLFGHAKRRGHAVAVESNNEVTTSAMAAPRAMSIWSATAGPRVLCLASSKAEIVSGMASAGWSAEPGQHPGPVAKVTEARTILRRHA